MKKLCRKKETILSFEISNLNKKIEDLENALKRECNKSDSLVSNQPWIRKFDWTAEQAQTRLQ